MNTQNKPLGNALRRAELRRRRDLLENEIKQIEALLKVPEYAASHASMRQEKYAFEVEVAEINTALLDL